MARRKTLNPRPVPDDFREVAPGKTLLQLQRHYKAGQKAVRRWLAETGLNEPRIYGKELPAGVKAMAETMSIQDIADAIGWPRTTLSSRMKATMLDAFFKARLNGERIRRDKRIARIVPKAPPAPARKMPLQANGRRQPAPQDNRVLSEAEKAMRYLQRFGPCFPLRIYAPFLDGYRFRGIRMDADALVAEARRRGWEPDAWRQIAA